MAVNIVCTKKKKKKKRLRWLSSVDRTKEDTDAISRDHAMFLWPLSGLTNDAADSKRLRSASPAAAAAAAGEQPVVVAWPNANLALSGLSGL